MGIKIIKESTYTEEKSKFFTDGERTIKLKNGDTVPDGYRPGRTFSSNPWNRGLTAETSEIVKQNTQRTHETRRAKQNYVSWNSGLTKDSDPRLQQVSSKVSQSRKGAIPWNKGASASESQKQKQSDAMRGRTPWNRGLTKETSDSILQTSKKLKGHECFVTDWDEAKKKEYETKRKNNSFNSSKIEQQLIDDMVRLYGEEDVIHPYRDSRYPYNCDMYIASQDLFIEVNGTAEHNNRPYDASNAEHVREAEEIKLRAEAKGVTSRYWNIYKWWTEIDPKKLNTFRKNNLNFKIIYPNGLIIEK